VNGNRSNRGAECGRVAIVKGNWVDGKHALADTPGIQMNRGAMGA
jgi:hypothetical protein